MWLIVNEFEKDISMKQYILLLIAMVFTPLAVQYADEPEKKSLPLPGEVFSVKGHTAFVILPQDKTTRNAIPWVWYAPTLPGLPADDEKWMFERFTQAGIAIAGIDVGESFGSPDGRAIYSALHEELTAHRGFAAQAIMLGRSRGGLMTLCWAAENADKVAGFAGIYPVCNIASYPGVTNACGAYRMTAAELSEHLAEHNPIDRLAALAKTGVPLFAIHGDRDQIVPLESNSGEMRKRYEALGGRMELIVPPGQGHNMWEGFFKCQQMVDFVVSQAERKHIKLSSPLDYQVVQRKTKDKGIIVIKGKLAAAEIKMNAIEARIRIGEKNGEWERLEASIQESAFRATMEIPAGGWYRIEVRALSGDKVIAEATVDHVGMGEVFVVAGQSNSANHGEEQQTTKTGMVATFDGKRWQPSNDPQPGASGGSGSFLPPFGDMMAQRFNVPVGLIACGIGATSVREWLPKGAKFPNPPTLTGRVQQLPSGEWESKGEAFTMFVERLRQLARYGFRAVLWHQGESDANQTDKTRTLAGNLYREYLEKLIYESRREIGWDANWFVAQVSYHIPGDESSPDIRAAQKSLWDDGIALEGPDSDALKGDLRENNGKGVHFSGKGLREHAARWVEKVAPWLENQTRRMENRVEVRGSDALDKAMISKQPIDKTEGSYRTSASPPTAQPVSKTLEHITLTADKKFLYPIRDKEAAAKLILTGFYSDKSSRILPPSEARIKAKTKNASGNVDVVAIEGDRVKPGEGGIATIEAMVEASGKQLKATTDIVVIPFFRDYHQTLVLKLFMGMEGEPVERLAKEPLFLKQHDVLCTFEEALEVIRKTDNLTRGIPKIVYLVGWQKGGHDHGYPSWSEVNPRMKRQQDSTALDSLRWLIREARNYNTTVSLHINMVDAYKKSSLWDEYVAKDCFARDETGQLLVAGIQMKGEEMYNVVYPREWEAGLAQRRIDGLIEMIPELLEGHTIHVDVFIAQRDGGKPISPWHLKPENGGLTPDKYVETQRKIFHYWRERGFDVTGEGIFWAHPPGEGFTGLQAMSWWYPDDRNYQMQIPERLMARGRTDRGGDGDFRFGSSMHGEEIWQKDKEEMIGPPLP